MALKFFVNASELLQRSYYRRGNQVIVSVNILKRKCYKKLLSYYYVINLNVCKIQRCSKKQPKFFKSLLKRKLFPKMFPKKVPGINCC